MTWAPARMIWLRGLKPRELLFRVSVALKGLDGALEILGAAGLFAVSPQIILRMVMFLTQGEIMEDPHDLIANYLRHAAAHLSLSSKHFMAIYLLVHGLVKIVLVGALLKHKLRAFPVSIIVFTAFIVYQLYRYTLTHAAGLLVLSVFDLVVIALIYLEYRMLQQRTAGLTR